MESPQARITTLLRSPRGRLLLRILMFAISAAREQRSNTTSARRHLRRVDARTGNPASLRQTLIVLGTRETVQRLIGGADRRRQGSPQEAALAELHEQMRDAQRQYADDPAKQQEAVMRIYQESRVQPFATCLPVLIRSAATITINHAPIPFLSERRTIPDLLAGTKLVRLRPSRLSRLGKRRRGGSAPRA